MNSENTQEVQDCAVCLQKCHFPTQLPCGHIFCFLCVKGVAIQSRKCAMCRAEIPRDYLDHPVLLGKIADEQTSAQANEGYQWYYEGRNGWWKYDERSNVELEIAFNGGEGECKLLLAGALYCIDFTSMIQVQSRDPTRRRRVRRDTPTLPAKGIAGIKIVDNEQAKSESDDTPSNNVNLTDEVIEIVDDDATDGSLSETTAPISPQNNSLSDVLQRISSMDLQDQNQNESISSTEET